MSGVSLNDIPPDVKQKILNDPQVQEAVRQQAAKAGKDAVEALKDPEVQQVILRTVQEKAPEYAEMARQKITEFVSDPVVQAKAKEALGVVGGYVMSAGGHLVATIEQGPAGVRMLSFIAGIISCANCVSTVINPLGLFTGTIGYVLAAYQLLFAATTIMFEMPPSLIQKMPGIHQYQDMLMDKCKFLSETNGRGFFYFFQGTLWMCFASLTKILDLAAGISMIFVGFLNMLVHYGGYNTFAEKVKQGYSKLSGP